MIRQACIECYGEKFAGTWAKSYLYKLASKGDKGAKRMSQAKAQMYMRL